MKTYSLKTIIYCLFLTLIFTTTMVNARGETLSKQQAITIAQQIYPGRILAVKKTGDIFKVKILSENGEVRIIKIDARSGEVVHHHHDDNRH